MEAKVGYFIYFSKREAFERYLDIENYVLLYLSKKQLNNDTKNN